MAGRVAGRVLQLLARELEADSDKLAARLMKDAKLDAGFFQRLSGAGVETNGAAQRLAFQKASAAALKRVAADLYPSRLPQGPGRIAEAIQQGQREFGRPLMDNFAGYLKAELQASDALKNVPGQVISKAGFLQNGPVDMMAKELWSTVQHWVLSMLGRALF